jgi:2-iminobutanoate/2-iminopropanoate deaminase
MKKAIETGLARVAAPISWATVGNGILFTAQIPFDENGKLVGTDIREQTTHTLRNLAQTLMAAGATMDDVTQVVVYLIQREDVPGMNEVYRQFFKAPYHNRATIIVAGLTVPGMRVEMLAYAAVGGAA